MRAVAGFSQTPGNYYLKRGYAEPPDALVLKIWSWVHEALAMYERGDIKKVDLCGIEFLRLLKKLRVVSLQDAACYGLSPSINTPLVNAPVCRLHVPHWVPIPM